MSEVWSRRDLDVMLNLLKRRVKAWREELAGPREEKDLNSASRASVISGPLNSNVAFMKFVAWLFGRGNGLGM